jgi:antibiotic biosynthesis monooxygenase (ABM) superfamily enzyme
MSAPASNASGRVTIVTQTRVVPGKEAEFARWQQTIGAAVQACPGFIEQTVTPPNPPVQTDWVILQRFQNQDSAVAWLHSDHRYELVKNIVPILVGNDDIHIVPDGTSGVLPSPVSAVISTRIKAGGVAAYRAWEHKIAAAQSQAPGFQGYKFEPPIPGVQDNWLAIVRFDSDANLQAWMNSPERLALLKEAESFTEEFHARIVRTGFDQWFQLQPGAPPPAAWKMNMLVLMLLYPVVFLFGALVQTPFLTGRGMPFWLALFLGNIVSVLLLSWLVPLAAQRFGWWLAPKGPSVTRINLAGAAVVIAIYVLWLAAFGLYSSLH